MTSLLSYELKIIVASYKKEDFDDEQDLLKKCGYIFDVINI
jgi:hypothetical protein